MRAYRSPSHRRTGLLALLAVLALAGCGAPSTTQPTAPLTEQPTARIAKQPPIEPSRTPSPSADALSTPTAIPTIQPRAAEQTAVPADPVVLVREQDAIRLELSSGALTGSDWLDATHLLMHWSTSTAPQVNATYLLDVSSGRLQHLASNLGQPSAHMQPAGQLAIIGWAAQVGLIDLRSGALETVFAHDPAVTQWAGEAEHQWDFGDLPGSFSATWTGADTFVLTESPADPARNLRNWGKLMLVDISAQRVQVLAAQGHLAAVFPDGSLLIRPGWMDGALQLFAPDGAAAPIPVTPGGPWSDSWTVSPDGQRVAWLEWNPPRGDWSDKIPHACCSGEPHPTIRDIAVWSRTSQTLQRFPASDMRWAFSYLGWRANSRALLFGRTPSDDFSAALFQLDLDGKEILLARHPENDFMVVDFEAPDGSLYYVIAQTGTSGGSFMHRDPKGRLEELAEMDVRPEHPLLWSSDHKGHLILRYGLDLDAKTVVQEIVTGRILAPEEVKKLNAAIPGSQWLIQGLPGPTIHIRRKQ
jgi:hypothetical protein